MILCPLCGKIAHYNSYFDKYMCSKCRWRGQEPKPDAESYNKERKKIMPNNLFRGKPVKPIDRCFARVCRLC